MNRRCSGLCFDDSIIATCTHVMPRDEKDSVFISEIFAHSAQNTPFHSVKPDIYQD